jgi:hypothetical protein
MKRVLNPWRNAMDATVNIDTLKTGDLHGQNDQARTSALAGATCGALRFSIGCRRQG